jgi:hypothetical protein
MPIDRDLIRSIRGLDEYDLRRLMIFVRGLLLNRDGPGFADAESGPARTGVTYRQEHVRCGKRGCTRCPHGPYWYAYWREDGRLRSRYIGKTLPEPVEAPSSTD